MVKTLPDIVIVFVLYYNCGFGTRTDDWQAKYVISVRRSVFSVIITVSTTDRTRQSTVQYDGLQ
jgi:hypothetical protein